MNIRKLFGMAGGMRVHIGRDVYAARYFNDMVFNSGINLYLSGCKDKAGQFLCGLPGPVAFEEFVARVRKPDMGARLGRFLGLRR